jgi:hypothetical protein
MPKSETHKQNISKSLMGHPSYLLAIPKELHPNFGTCWIYNRHLKQSRMIKKEELALWISSGWSKGRKIKF